MIDTVVIPQVEAGTLRGLAVFGTERLPSLPNIPTLEEVGVTGIPASGWTGLFAPKDTPAEIIEQISFAIEELYKDEEFTQSLINVGVTPDFQDHLTFQESVLSDNKLFGDFIETMVLD